MKKKYILKKKSEFDRIITNTKPVKTPNFLFYLETNSQAAYYFGFVVSKKNGNAVVRNKIKRIMRQIVGRNKYINGFNCIIMSKKGVEKVKFNILEKEINEYLTKNRLVDDNE